MRFRFAEPDALFMVELLIRLGEVGAFDLEGSLRKIGMQIGELLGEQPDQVRLYRGMRALAGQTCLVERVSRQIWRLCLAGITDPTSARHRRLLDETPSPCHLDAAPRALLQPQDHALARNEADDLRAELVALNDRHERMVAEVEALRRERDEAVRSEREQAEKLAAELRRFDEAAFERDIKIEDLERQLAAAREAQAVAPPTQAEGDKPIALKATLKSERERRRAAETRLRQVLSALKIKIDASSDTIPVADVDLDRALLGSLTKALEEHLLDLEEDSDQDDVEGEPGRAAERQTDIELTGSLLGRLGLRVPRPPRTSGR